MLFVLNLYCNTRPNDVDTLGSLQWYMFSKYQYEGDKLPLTKHALLHMMYRSHYMARVWQSYHISKPIFPDPLNKFGWKLSENIENCYEPIMTDKKPAPASVAELSFCRFKHGCDIKRCTFKKNNLICSEMCFCQDCENQPIFPEELSLNDNENEDNENGTDDIG